MKWERALKRTRRGQQLVYEQAALPATGRRRIIRPAVPHGRGVAQDLQQAGVLVCLIGCSGYTEGIKNYIHALEHGEGVRQDIQQAAYWHNMLHELEKHETILLLEPALDLTYTMLPLR